MPVVDEYTTRLIDVSRGRRALDETGPIVYGPDGEPVPYKAKHFAKGEVTGDLSVRCLVPTVRPQVPAVGTAVVPAERGQSTTRLSWASTSAMFKRWVATNMGRFRG